MDYIRNKDELSMTPQIYNDYINLIIDEIFKLLPIYEGKNKNGVITFSKGQAYYYFLIERLE